MTSPKSRLTLLAAWCSLAVVAPALADDEPADLSKLKEQAFRAAVDQVAPAVLRIETVGGLERIGKIRFGEGPTTGLVVSPDGYVISSAFNFAQQPSQVIVVLPSGKRAPAKIVATDLNRMLTLLKVDSDEKLPVAEAADPKTLRVGQWAIALGRTFDGERPNMSVGIISALGRIWGKAVQTDAKVSPVNYGGPLVDVNGRVIGVLVPLSPNASGQMAGVEWYDSGIGFAVPLAHINRVLPQMKRGEDLKPGVLGVALKGANQFSGVPEIASVRPNSPAAKADLKAGDKIVEVDGSPITRTAALKHRLSNRYAGDEVTLLVQRGDEKIKVTLTLAGDLEKFKRAYLGVLPLRDASDAAGVAVRHVDADSPAAAAGIQPGDVIHAVGGKAVADAAALREAIGTLAAGTAVKLQVKTEGNDRALDVTLGEIPSTIAAELPPAHADPGDLPDERPEVGVLRPKVPEFKNESLVYVPEAYHPAVPHGLVVWLHPAGRYKEDELLRQWKPLCDAHDLILVAPLASEADRWLPTEVDYVAKLVEPLTDTYNVDGTRIVAHGYKQGGNMASRVAFTKRDLFRALVAIEAVLPGKVPAADPVQPLSIYAATAVKVPNFQQIKASIDSLRESGHPLVLKNLGDVERYLDAEELAELVRWIDSLDRI